MRRQTATIARGGLRETVRPVLLGLILVCLVLVAYHEAPDNGFHLDDSDNITRHGPVRMQRFSLEGLRQAWEKPFLPRRPLPSLTFAVDWWRGGGQPRAFQWTNVAIHATAALVLMLLLREILRAWKRVGTALGADLAAACAAAAWALHPIQAQAVCYIVQRMALLATLFSILAVWLYLRGRLAAVPRRRYLYWLAALASLVLGLLSKEVAVLTLGLVLLLEIGLCRVRPLSLRHSLDRVLLIAVVLAFVVMIADLVGGGPLAGWLEPRYGLRRFTLAERLMTQPRVVFFHLSQIVLPLPSRFSIEHGFPLSTSLLTPGRYAAGRPGSVRLDRTRPPRSGKRTLAPAGFLPALAAGDALAREQRLCRWRSSSSTACTCPLPGLRDLRHSACTVCGAGPGGARPWGLPPAWSCRHGSRQRCSEFPSGRTISASTPRPCTTHRTPRVFVSISPPSTCGQAGSSLRRGICERLSNSTPMIRRFWRRSVSSCSSAAICHAPSDSSSGRFGSFAGRHPTS